MTDGLKSDVVVTSVEAKMEQCQDRQQRAAVRSF